MDLRANSSTERWAFFVEKMNEAAPRDPNRNVVLIGVSSTTTGAFIEGVTPVAVAVNPSTNAVLVEST